MKRSFALYFASSSSFALCLVATVIAATNHPAIPFRGYVFLWSFTAAGVSIAIVFFTRSLVRIVSGSTRNRYKYLVALIGLPILGGQIAWGYQVFAAFPIHPDPLDAVLLAMVSLAFLMEVVWVDLVLTSTQYST